MIDETFDYKGYHVQRMTKDCLWYVTFENKIVYWHQYRNDIKSWIDARTSIVQHRLYGSDSQKPSTSKLPRLIHYGNCLYQSKERIDRFMSETIINNQFKIYEAIKKLGNFA